MNINLLGYGVSLYQTFKGGARGVPLSLVRNARGGHDDAPEEVV
jgi:hypothetical protein